MGVTRSWSIEGFGKRDKLHSLSVQDHGTFKEFRKSCFTHFMTVEWKIQSHHPVVSVEVRVDCQGVKSNPLYFLCVEAG